MSAQIRRGALGNMFELGLGEGGSDRVERGTALIGSGGICSKVTRSCFMCLRRVTHVSRVRLIAVSIHDN